MSPHSPIVTAMLTVIFGVSQGLPPSTGSNPNQIDVDINGRYVVIKTPAPRDWNGLTVEINGSWTYPLKDVARVPSICVDAEAFTLRGGAVSNNSARDGQAVYLNLTAINVKSVSVLNAAGTALALHSMTKGLIKSLTSREAASCLGRTKGK